MTPKLDTKFGTYRLRTVVRLPSGKRERISATGDSKTDCRAEFDRKRRAAEEADLRGAVKAPTGTKPIETFAREWLAAYPAAVGNRTSTVTGKRYHVEMRILPYFAKLAEERGTPVTLADVTPKVIDGFLAHLASAPALRGRAGAAEGETRLLSAKSAQNISQTLRKLLRTAARWGELDAAPEVPRPKAPKAEFDYLDFGDAERFLAAARDDEERGLLMTGLKAGLRAGELLGLQWPAVDLARRQLRVDQQLAPGGSLAPPKAGSRTVPMSGQLVGALKAIKHLRGPFVFCDQDGRPFNRGDLRRMVTRTAKRAGLRYLHPHVLRHSYASHLAMKAVPIVQIQKWLGHTSITMTMRYAHLAPGSGDHLVDVLDAPADQTNRLAAGPGQPR